jgi:hypothetical protein
MDAYNYLTTVNDGQKVLQVHPQLGANTASAWHIVSAAA